MNMNLFARCATRAFMVIATLLGATQIDAAAVAYIPNQTGSSVSVVDVNTGTVTTSVPVGDAPIGVAAAPGGGLVYVAQHNANTVAVISTNTNTVLAQISAGNKPMGVAVSPDGSRLYVSNFLTATASGGGSLWVNGTVTVVDTVTRNAIATVTVGPNPYGLAASSDGSRVFVANSGAGTVSVVDTASNTVTSTINVGANPVGVAASPDGQRVYVANSGTGSVSVIDTATLTVSSTIPVGGHAMGVAVSDDSTRVVVSNSFDKTVSVINAATLAVLGAANGGVGHGPAGIAFVPGGTTALVANSRAGSVSSVNASNSTASVLPGSFGWPVSIGKFIASTPACSLDVSGDTTIAAASDGMLMLRYMLGFRGAALTAGVTGIAAGRSPAQIEQNIAALNLDADGDSAVRSTTDGLLLVRALLHLTDNALIANARNTGFVGVRDAAQVLQWISTTHGTSCLL